MALATAACANGAPALAPNSLRWTLRLVRRLPGQSVRPSSNSIAQLPLPISRLLHLPNSKQLIVAARVALLAQRLGALRFLIRCRTSSPPALALCLDSTRRVGFFDVPTMTIASPRGLSSLAARFGRLVLSHLALAPLHALG